jgi:hypothetical protein
MMDTNTLLISLTAQADFSVQANKELRLKLARTRCNDKLAEAEVNVMIPHYLKVT